MRPSPALQCTATPPGSLSTMSKKRSTISELGHEPSTKNRSKCRKPPFVNAAGLYSCVHGYAWRQGYGAETLTLSTL